MTKILTYPTYGTGIPDLIRKTAGIGTDPDKHCDIYADKTLVDLVDSFVQEGIQEVTESLIHENPDKLFLFKTNKGADGITRHYLFGHAGPDEFRPGSSIVKVCLNVYDEASMKVHIDTYDGSESLELLPEYVPVEGVPGLYRKNQ